MALLLFSLTALVVPFRQERKKKRKMVIVNLGGKKKPPTQGITTDASTKMHSPFRTSLSASWYGADTAFPKKIPSGRTEVKGRNRAPGGMVGRQPGGLEGRSAAFWECLTACTPEAGLPSSAMSWQMSLEDRCPQVFWMSGMDFLSEFLVLSLTFPSSLSLLLSLSSPFGAHHLRISLPAE